MKYLPLLSPRQHRLQALPGIGVGSHVTRGQCLATNVWGEALHAPEAGVLLDLRLHPVAWPEAPEVPTWTFQPDAVQAPLAYQPQPPRPLRPHLERLRVVGQGGAAFLAQRKWPREVKLLVINAMECEPDITADAALLTTAPETVIQGILWLREALAAERTVLALKPGLPCPPLPPEVTVQVLPGTYPAGAERLLLPRLSSILPGVLPAMQGVVCHNVGTAYAVWQSLTQNLPPLGRWLSLGGSSLGQPQALWASYGTPLRALLAVGAYDGQGQVRVGGRYSGYALLPQALDAPLQAHINALYAAPARPVQAPLACIHCGWCAEICPVHLQPQVFYQALQAQKSPDPTLQQCLVCGLCETVCPSQIPLNAWLRQGKAVQRQQQAQAQQAAAATARYGARTQRLVARAEAEAAQRVQRLAEHLDAYRNDPLRLAKLHTAQQREE